MCAGVLLTYLHAESWILPNLSSGAGGVRDGGVALVGECACAAVDIVGHVMRV